jgi:hypothetical protein
MNGGGFHSGRRINILKSALRQPEVAQAIGFDFDRSSDDPPVSTLTQELDNLVGCSFFNAFDHTAPAEELSFVGAYAQIQSTAPVWASWLSNTLANPRHERDHYQMSATYNESLQLRAYLITAIICRARARKTSNYLSRALGIYLLGSGTKRRVVETLAGLGVCESYQCINQLLSCIANEAKVRLRAW